MAEKVNRQDFVEIDYTGKLPDGTIFDTTKEDVAKSNGLHSNKSKYGSMTIVIGERQILPGLDDQLEGKEVGQTYTIPLQPENAFGKRDVKNMRIIPMNTFMEHKMQPQAGLQIEVDGQLGTITRVSGGRVIVNFNHPLAGREVVYEITINKLVTDKKEQITSFLNTSLRMPENQIKVSINEDQAEVELPMQLPLEFTGALGKKLKELTKLKDIKFSGRVPAQAQLKQ